MIPPLKFVDQLDLTDTRVVGCRARPIRETEVRNLNHIEFLCKILDNAANIQQEKRTPSLGDLVSLFNSDAVQAILAPTLTDNNRVRRAD